jgi:purine nucleosidase/pyrimidine-specific ribonucleoside hydrolase
MDVAHSPSEQREFGMKRILLDCDPGIDDSTAILFAIKSAELEIEAITTVSGNLMADRTSINALKTLELIGIDDIPVAKGIMHPLVRPYPRDPFSHGDDGLGNTGLPDPRLQLDPRFAPDVIVDTVDRFPGDIALVATGPLTNVAAALMKDPDMPRKVDQLILIGGAFGFNSYSSVYATGDNPVSEWNIFVDPESARLVFHSGIAITAIGLDVATHPSINFRESDIQKLHEAANRESAYLLDLIRFVTERNFKSYCVLIDSMAIAAAIDPTVIQTKEIFVDIETKGELTLGQTVVDFRENFTWTHLPQIKAAYDADFPRFLDMLITAITKPR